MATATWDELLGSAVKKKVIVDGDGDAPDFGNVVVFNWKGSELVNGIEGIAGTAFGERNRATARIGDGDEIPGTTCTAMLLLIALFFQEVFVRQLSMWESEVLLVVPPLPVAV